MPARPPRLNGIKLCMLLAQNGVFYIYACIPHQVFASRWQTVPNEHSQGHVTNFLFWDPYHSVGMCEYRQFKFGLQIDRDDCK